MGVAAIGRQCHSRGVLIDWTEQFGRWLNRVEADARAGDQVAMRVESHVTAQLRHLQQLAGPPVEPTATLPPVAQSGRYPVWRVSHPPYEGTAVRLIVWFPEDGCAVIVLFAGDKARLGDVFDSSVGGRADAAIHWWIQRSQREERR